jgi:hypothetical protein
LLRLSTEHRPRQLLALYVEQQRVEVLRAHRQWRSWQIDSAEHFEIPEGESIYDYLQRLNLRPRNRKATTLILILPLTFYTFHREHYPSGLSDQLQDALNYDWQENLFLEHERTLHFSGPAVPLNHNLSVPIFSLQREIFEKFQQVLGAPSFQNFRVIPTAPMYRAFLASQQRSKDEPELEIYARLIDSSHLEVHRLYKGQLLDSMLFGKSRDDFMLFLEHLRSQDNGQGEQATSIHLICADGEIGRAEAYQGLCEDAACFEIQPLDGTLIASWVAYLLNQDQIETFDAQLFLKPWKMPRIVWPIVALLGLYSIFAVYQIHAHRQLQDTSRRLKKEIAQQETEWKPIEQLQTRIAKFQEDQKTLSEFNKEGYPLYEVLGVLSQTTPEDTWLNYFSIRKGQIILRGDSKSAIKYLSELSKIEGFSDVRFASPVTRSPSSEDERFNVQFQLDPDKLKKTADGMELFKEEEIAAPNPAEQTSPVPKTMKKRHPTETEEDAEDLEDYSPLEEEDAEEVPQ